MTDPDTPRGPSDSVARPDTVDQPLHQRLRFDLDQGEVRDGPRRYVIMRCDVLMGLFGMLSATERAEALHALGRSVETFGGDSVRAYLASAGQDRLLRTMEQASAALGWGRWRLRAEADALSLQVENSPFAAGARWSDRGACDAITGMLGAVAGALWNAPVAARELRCACADSNAACCLFEARRATRARR
jgi:uncharacterized protein